MFEVFFGKNRIDNFVENQNDMETHYWSTKQEHFDNSETMDDYLSNHLSGDFEVLANEGTYAEIRDEKGIVWGVSASGNGDFRNHKVEFEKLTN